MAMPIQLIGETLDFETPESSNNGCTFFHEVDHASPQISRVFFNFKCPSFHCRWLPNLNSCDQIALPIKETCFQMTDDELSRRPQAELFIHNNLLRWPIVYGTNRKKLVLFALEKAAEALQSMPGELNSVKIDIPVNVVSDYIVWQAMEEEDEEEEEEEEVHMRPTAEGAMYEFLKGGGKVVMEKMDCVVCLEEMESGSEGKEMPCSHLFHEDCIMRWLRTSHYCPICRFELPIAP